MDQHTKCLWMKQLLERLQVCHDQWQSTAGAPNRHLARSIERDLRQFRWLCQSLRRDVLAGVTS